MSGGSLVVFGSWLAQDGRVDEVIVAVSCVLEYAKSNREDISSLYLLRSKLAETLGNEVRVVAWFKNEQAYQKYLASSTVVDLKILCENKRLLQTAPYERIVYPRAGFIRRAETHPDPCVVIASVRYKSSRRDDGIRLFSAIADSVKVEEKGAYTYLFTADAQDEGLMWSFERYTDESYLRQIHIPRADVQENIGLQKDMRQTGGLHHWYWKQIAEVHAPDVDLQ